MLLASGFVPRRRAEKFQRQLWMGLGIVILAVVIIAIPLYRALEIAVDRAQVTAAANEAVDDWLGDASLELSELNITHESAEVVLVGVDDPPDIAGLSARLEADLGMPIDVRVIWYQGETRVAHGGERDR